MILPYACVAPGTKRSSRYSMLLNSLATYRLLTVQRCEAVSQTHLRSQRAVMRFRFCVANSL
eukprot:3893708-Lingulodinium_polyedra.AAC.1